ncbi:myotubularin-related protein 10-like, partial [Narcine bancroftii]|uniref:myotubularin-related protein 10-like n=1 Tax=Narcine bancroftii TaxID=1343680 RepID=UPI0038322664
MLTKLIRFVTSKSKITILNHSLPFQRFCHRIPSSNFPTTDVSDHLDLLVGRANGTGTDWQTPLFETYADWDREIKRTGASEWRVSSVNENYATSTSLPEYFVVPSSLADEDLKQLAPSFNGARIPMWCWHHWTGSALVRMANIKPGIQLRKHDRRILKAIAQSHPEKSEVFKSDLDKMLPRVSEVQAALVRLKQLCIHDSFEETDEKWLSSLENTRWLEYVRLFLKHSAELTQWMYSKNISVILQEEEGRDLSCVVASVMQLMLDPHFRTTRGFQSLIQKEWVAAGYRFLDRCNHLHQSEKNEFTSRYIKRVTREKIGRIKDQHGDLCVEPRGMGWILNENSSVFTVENLEAKKLEETR